MTTRSESAILSARPLADWPHYIARAVAQFFQKRRSQCDCVSFVRLAAMASLLLAAQFCIADDDTWGLKPGSVELKSAGPLAFGPDGILFVGDPTSATVYAVSTGDVKGNPGSASSTFLSFSRSWPMLSVANQIKRVSPTWPSIPQPETCICRLQQVKRVPHRSSA